MAPGRRRAARRRAARLSAAALCAAAVLWIAVSCAFAHRPKAWRDAKRASWPAALVDALEWAGLPAADLTDAFGWTGRDATAVSSRPAPSGSVAFAGFPVRVAPPAPDDIQILERGDFAVGWSPRLRHPVWCAYHVPEKARFEAGPRPSFRKDRRVKSSPAAAEYAKTGYDRGHMAPNWAIATRFGPKAQADTFLTTNVAPQTPSLNRGVWRDVEHRIADFWTARWGEIWVIVGTVSSGMEMLSGGNVDVPEKFYQIAVAQSGGEIRVLAAVFGQDVPWRAWPTDYIATVDEIEQMSGLDFFPGLDDAAEEKLESARPTRMWPVRFLDAFRQLLGHNG